MEKGKILLALTGIHPQRWHELLSAEREVVLEPNGANDPSIAYAVVWNRVAVQPPSTVMTWPQM